MPIWFEETYADGNDQKGRITLHSSNDFDENWGSNAKMEILWEPKDRLEFAHYKEVQNTIEEFRAIDMSVSKKENTWMRSHEFTYWYGSRRKRIGRNFYVERAIHGVFYCDQTQRLFSIHTGIIEQLYDNFKQLVKDAYMSIHCH
jgi:uncharacterized protein YbaR (Trm112 family)